MTLALDIHLVAVMLVLPLWAVWELPSILNNVHLTTAVEKLYFGKLFILQVIYYMLGPQIHQGFQIINLLITAPKGCFAQLGLPTNGFASG